MGGAAMFYGASREAQEPIVERVQTVMPSHQGFSASSMRNTERGISTTQVHVKETSLISNPINLNKATIKLSCKGDDLNDCILEFMLHCRVDVNVNILARASSEENAKFNTHVLQSKCCAANKDIDFKCSIDLSFTKLEDLHSRPSPESPIHPFVIHIEEATVPSKAQHALYTFCRLDQSAIHGTRTYRLISYKQTYQYGNVAYDLHDIFGLSHATDTDRGECVVCLSATRDTAILPCRHMCLCGECANNVRTGLKSCPICRQSVESFIQIPEMGACPNDSSVSSH